MSYCPFPSTLSVEDTRAVETLLISSNASHAYIYWFYLHVCCTCTCTCTYLHIHVHVHATPLPCTQDHLMVVYLFNLVKTQLVLGEKLSQITWLTHSHTVTHTVTRHLHTHTCMASWTHLYQTLSCAVMSNTFTVHTYTCTHMWLSVIVTFCISEVYGLVTVLLMCTTLLYSCFYALV